jgi:hypothetical protein
MNTDTQHLEITEAPVKIQLGERSAPDWEQAAIIAGT